MSYLNAYKKRVGLGHSNRRDKLVFQAERTFERQLKESPSAMTLKATIPGQIDVLGNTNELEGIMLNISDNDIKAFDQKYWLVRKDANFDIGCYVEFDGAYWLASYKEHRTLDTHKKFTLYKCNNIWNYKVAGVVYRFPIYVQNLSLYSDGLADNKYTSQEDGKLSVYYGENAITKGAVVNTRIMIGNRTTFRMTNINDYEFRSSHNGLCTIKAMLLQTSLLDVDDTENNIAWNPVSEGAETRTYRAVRIVGEDIAMIGSKKRYDVENASEGRWEIECSKELKKYIQLITPEGDRYCEIKFPSSPKFIGDKVTVNFFDGDVIKDAMEITLKGM